MKYKIHKTIILIVTVLIAYFSLFQSPVYADDEKTEESTWLNDAFASARAFLTQSSTEVPQEVGTLFNNITMTIRGINRALWVLLGGVSAISLSIVGIRYILGINSSDERGKAKTALHQTIRGMAIGFGAILIFNIVMIFVRLIINSL